MEKSQSIMTMLSQIFEEVMNDMCDNYCKFPALYSDQDELWDEQCDKCPLNKLK